MREAVAAGIAKVNIGTALNVAFTAALRGTLEAATSSDPRGYLASARSAMSDVAAHLLTVVSI